VLRQIIHNKFHLEIQIDIDLERGCAYFADFAGSLGPAAPAFGAVEVRRKSQSRLTGEMP